MIITLSFNYQDEIEKIYNDARWEAYYDRIIIPIFAMCCKDKSVKIVPVHATRKSGRKPIVQKRHFIEKYSIVKEVLENGKVREKRFGIPDFVIVPKDSTYENPKDSLINIEFKLPEGLTSEYIEINPKRHKAELLNQFEYCGKIILTDGVTWYFFENKEDIENTEPIRLYDKGNNCWKLGDEALDTEAMLLEKIKGLIDMVLCK